MTHVEDLTAALDTLRANADLTTTDWAKALVEQGWAKQAVAPVKIISGSHVEVMVRGDWVPGRVLSVGPGGLLDIAHERGSISAYAKGSNVRLPQK